MKQIHSNGPTNKKDSQRNYNGIFTLVTIVAFLSIVRWLIEDYKDYGFIMNFPLKELTLNDSFFSSLIFSILCLSSLFCFLFVKRHHTRVEKELKGGGVKANSNLLYTFYFTIYITISFSITSLITFFAIEHVYISGWTLIVSLVVHIKLSSFFLTNDKLSTLSQDIIFRHFLYFIVAPTLCYQLKYPKNKSRNIKRVVRRGLQLILGIFLFVFVMDQYSISSIFRIMESNNILVQLENTLNLAISTAFLFLIFFHLVFYCGFDIISELTLFQDRRFYQAWWNSTTVGEFWSLWNIPVHNWFKIHLYVPLLINGYSKNVARACCFFVSAVLHEFVFSVATKKFSGLVFLAMILQIPNIYVSEFVKEHFPRLANIFFWCSFCVIGQPGIVLLYYRSQYLKGLH